jgi:type VI secretion system secreted protein VgrG
MDCQEKVRMHYALDSGMEIHLKSGMTMVLESGVSLTLKVGGNFININPGGIFVSGTMVMINSGGSAGSGSGSSPAAPTDPDPAATDKAGQVEKTPSPPPIPNRNSACPAATVLQQGARTGTPFCEISSREAT